MNLHSNDNQITNIFYSYSTSSENLLRFRPTLDFSFRTFSRLCFQAKYYEQQSLRREVHRLMREKGDYKGYFYHPVTGRQLRAHRVALEQNNINVGMKP